MLTNPYFSEHEITYGRARVPYTGKVAGLQTPLDDHWALPGGKFTKDKELALEVAKRINEFFK